MGRIDYTSAAAGYRAFRSLPREVAGAWEQAIGALRIGPVERVLDLGAGPGLFLGHLHDWFGAPITAVEPSVAMRREAQAGDLPEHCAYIGAVGERLPLRSSSHGLAWLSTVVHQLDDLEKTARELRRVISPGGSVLVRNLFGDMEPVGLLTRFPGAERAVRWFPPTEAIVDAFVRAGFSPAARVDVTERRSQSASGWVSLLEASRSSDSLLRQLTDREFRAGLRSIRGDGASPSRSIVSDLTLRLIHLRAPEDLRSPGAGRNSRE